VPICANYQKTPRKWFFLLAQALLIMTTVLFSSSPLSAFATPIEKGVPPEIKEHYSPELKYCWQDPMHPNPNEYVEVYANFFDKYSNINNATLIYSINGGQWASKQMKLINGIPSNGTYQGDIPPAQNESVTVNYRVEAKDELNYTSYSSERVCQGEYNVTDLEIIELESFEDPKENQPVVISADIKDSDTGIKNVELYYRNESFDSDKYELPLRQDAPSNPVGYAVVKMRPVDDRTYNATIPPVPVNRSVYYFIEANDYEGNKDRSLIRGYSTSSYKKTEYPYCYEKANRINVTSNIKGLDFTDYTANTQFTVSGFLVNGSLFLFQDGKEYPGYYFKPGPFDYSYKYGGYLEGISVEDKDVKNIFAFALSQDESTDECAPDYQNIQNANNTDYVSLPLSGDPLAFPFDHYYINLMLDVPYRNLTFDYIDEESNLLNTGFSYSSIIENTPSLNLNPDCTTENESQTWLCQKDLRDGSTIMNVRYNFNRTYSIATIIIPIVAIFYLLGAIFLFENSSENIGKRLTLTLGIFALLFTLPNIISSLKPQTSAPTIADSMLSIIIIASIAFTISSILSSTSILQKWFPKHYSLIDGIVFIIISGFVISYFSNYLFDSELWWLIPLIIFGLGYGLLLRALGVKINRPLLSIRKGKNM
jgi:hypothetical protein